MPLTFATPLDPDEVKDYSVNWASRLDEGDTIQTSEWIVPNGVTEDSSSNTATTTTIWLSGGTLGTHLLVNRITTAGGRTLDQTCKLKVKVL